ncbi:MAG: hypothetical protein EBR15_08670, partial [Gammaproteobacteria bacterium]|nr:hypothetical protein [Gammaproteobacteria bacterium]
MFVGWSNSENDAREARDDHDNEHWRDRRVEPIAQRSCKYRAKRPTNRADQTDATHHRAKHLRLHDFARHHALERRMRADRHAGQHY